MLMTIGVGIQDDDLRRVKVKTITIDRDELVQIAKMKLELLGIPYDNVVYAVVAKIEFDKEEV